MTNFTFIKETLPEVYQEAVKSEKYLREDKRACAFYCRLLGAPSCTRHKN